MSLQLIKYLQLNGSLPPELLQEVVSNFTRHELKENRFLLKKGQIVDSYYFIEKGCFRSFYTHNEKEHTVWIESPGELICEIKSLRTQQPTEYSMQAMEHTTYLAIKAKVFDRLAEQHVELQRFLIHLWETRFMIAMDGLRAFQTLGAKQRYEFLLQNFPNIEKLSLQQIANILGITQSSLSRIRRQK
jgi:CRP-like cAMP-binding protein